LPDDSGQLEILGSRSTGSEGSDGPVRSNQKEINSLLVDMNCHGVDTTSFVPDNNSFANANGLQEEVKPSE
jgi:hypothetical protein